MATTDTATHALLIDGGDVMTARTRPVVDPATGEPIAEVADGSAADAERAVAGGARAQCGGEVIDGPGAFYAPTVVTGAPQSSEIVQQEVFGPVRAVLGLRSDDEALALANDTRHRLAASAWTRDVSRARRAARKPEAGTVWIDEHLAIGSEMPHGGVKGSGFGKDMSMYALEECTAIKHVVFELTGEPRKDSYDAVSSR